MATDVSEMTAGDMLARAPGLRRPPPLHDPKPDGDPADARCTLCGTRYAPHGACGYCRGRLRLLLTAERDELLARMNR